jgi:hypothetical protein
MGSSLRRGPVGRTVLPLSVVIGGFAALYGATANPFISAMWASLAAHVVLLMPLPRGRGRAFWRTSTSAGQGSGSNRPAPKVANLSTYTVLNLATLNPGHWRPPLNARRSPAP